MDGKLEVSAAAAEDGSIAVQILGTSEKDLRPALFRLAVDKGWTLLELRKDVMQLEEVFRELTVGDAKAGERIAAAGVNVKKSAASSSAGDKE